MSAAMRSASTLRSSSVSSSAWITARDIGSSLCYTSDEFPRVGS